MAGSEVAGGAGGGVAVHEVMRRRCDVCGGGWMVGWLASRMSVVLGGEALSGAVGAGGRRERLRMCVVVNAYGPTEATVDCGEWRLGPGGWRTGEVVPIGRPLEIRGCLCWMTGCVRCRWGLRVSCMWPVWGWRGGIWVVRV